MKYTVVKGDLLAANRGVIIHGCNDKGVMGSGVAAGIKARHPLAFEVYQDAFHAGELKIGTCTFYQHSNDLWVSNAVTQTLGTRNPLSYPAIKECFAATLNFMIALEAARGIPYGTLPLLFPMTGAGRAGGDWALITALIDEALDEANKAYSCVRPATLFVVDVEPADCR
jgi:O-acetyl-ADP-ribose deacetylase (regulator of RNase III)